MAEVLTDSFMNMKPFKCFNIIIKHVFTECIKILKIMVFFIYSNSNKYIPDIEVLHCDAKHVSYELIMKCRS